MVRSADLAGTFCGDEDAPKPDISPETIAAPLSTYNG